MSRLDDDADATNNVAEERKSAPEEGRPFATGRVPKIQPMDLRDVASEERIERIWNRLDQDVEALRVRPSPKPSRTLVWAIAATFAAFGAGLLVGRSVMHAPNVSTETPVAARDVATIDVFAAGSQERSYSLPGGGRITLTPGSMVELERTGGRDLRLRLLTGEASLDTGEGPGQALAIVSGEATVATAPGSMVSVQRHADNLDVRVVGGSAQVSSPAGTHALRKGEQMEDVPTRQTTAAVPPPVVRVSPGASVRVARNDPPAAAVPAATPSWRELHAASKFDEAADAFKTQVGPLLTAINSAKSAEELMVLSDLARTSNGDQVAAERALHRIADDFGSSTYGPIAAKQLARVYAQRNPELAKKYLDQAAQKKAFSEDAMCAQMLAEHQAGNKDAASARASEYLGKYPNGRCKDDANRILGGSVEDDDGSASETPTPSATASTSSAAPVAPSVAPTAKPAP